MAYQIIVPKVKGAEAEGAAWVVGIVGEDLYRLGELLKGVSVTVVHASNREEAEKLLQDDIAIISSICNKVDPNIIVRAVCAIHANAMC